MSPLGARAQGVGVGFLAGVLTLLGPGGANAQVSEPKEPDATLRRRFGDSGEELSREVRQVLDEGLAWLAEEQIDRRGAWPSKPTRYQMSVTGLAGLALLAGGSTPDSGPYALHLRRALQWVLDSQKTEGPWKGLLFDNADPLARDERAMHGHGFALLFLAEAYGEVRAPALRQRVHEAIAEGCRLTERSISRDGGWYYSPADSQHRAQHEGSVTITQIQALRAAHNAGVYVNPTVIQRAVNYIKESQSEDGGVCYMLGWSGKTSVALTAAGISVLHGAGEYHSDAIEKGYAYLRQHDAFSAEMRFFFYTHLYLSQAMFQRGGPSWRSYYPKVRKRLLEMRQGYPYWESPFGKSYGTAIALLILQLPRRYLPVHQR